MAFAGCIHAGDSVVVPRTKVPNVQLAEQCHATAAHEAHVGISSDHIEVTQVTWQLRSKPCKPVPE